MWIHIDNLRLRGDEIGVYTRQSEEPRKAPGGFRVPQYLRRLQMKSIKGSHVLYKHSGGLCIHILPPFEGHCWAIVRHLRMKSRAEGEQMESIAGVLVACGNVRYSVNLMYLCISQAPNAPSIKPMIAPA